MERLITLYENLYSVRPEEIIPLSGSGSNRRYYRMISSVSSCIGVVGTDVRENGAFLSIGGHFMAKGISVPEILAVSQDRMAYLQEDLGTEMLSDKVAEAVKTGWVETDDELLEMLCRTMAALPKIQFEGAAGLDFSVCYPQPSFDRRMVMFDLNYFKYCFLKPSGLDFDEVRLQDDFDRFADELLKEESDTFLYRDFNARNVMICGGRPYFIDFQGGRRGPIYYDVASFIWQARARYPEDIRKKMLDSYLEALAVYRNVERDEFYGKLRLFVLFRLMQVLGAYGFRGLMEHKAQFVVSIPPALAILNTLLQEPFEAFPYMTEILKQMTGLARFKDEKEKDGRLEVKVCSFSYKKGIPEDLSGNGGGYVFDCRSINNPGRYEQYRKLTGRDEPVIRFLEDDGEILRFLDHVYGVVEPHVETFSGRGFTDLMVSFGCTGGQHRSVYCAEHLARHLAERYPSVRVRLTHREQHIEELFNIGV